MARYSDVTPKSSYVNRRRFLAAACSRTPLAARAATIMSHVTPSPFSTKEQTTPFEAVTGYNNYYEFGTGKDEPVKLAKNYKTSPWTRLARGA